MNPLRSLKLRDRRAVLVGVAVLGPALFVGLGVRPYLRALAETRTRLVEQQGLLDRELALLADTLQFGAAADGARVALARMRGRLFAGDPLAAATGLAGYATETARRNGVLIEEIQSGPTTEAGAGITQVEVGTRGRSDLAGVMRWLRSLEAGGKLIRVERLSVERNDLTARPDSADTEVLTVVATLRGYVASEGTPQR